MSLRFEIKFWMIFINSIAFIKKRKPSYTLCNTQGLKIFNDLLSNFVATLRRTQQNTIPPLTCPALAASQLTAMPGVLKTTIIFAN